MLNTKYLRFLVFSLLIFVHNKSKADAENKEDLKTLRSRTNVKDSIDHEYKEYDKNADNYLKLKNLEDLRNLKKFWQLKIPEVEVQTNKSEKVETKTTTESPEDSELDKQEKHDIEITRRTNEILLNIEKRVLLAIIKKNTYGSESNIQENDMQEPQGFNKPRQSYNLFQKDILLTEDQAQELIMHAIKDAEKNNVDIKDIRTAIN
uniref:Fam-b protein n=1 Tax=Strongyloides venezuelensis TaxID=75913 RepID=A0A0K0FJU8_STRVS